MTVSTCEQCIHYWRVSPYPFILLVFRIQCAFSWQHSSVWSNRVSSAWGHSDWQGPFDSLGSRKNEKVERGGLGLETGKEKVTSLADSNVFIHEKIWRNCVQVHHWATAVCPELGQHWSQKSWDPCRWAPASRWPRDSVRRDPLPLCGMAAAQQARRFLVCVCVFFLFIISRFTRKSFEMHLFYREKENLAGMKFLRFPKSHCAVVQRFLGAFPWPPCRGQACPPSRPLLLPAMLFWVNTIWGVWFFISPWISSSFCKNWVKSLVHFPFPLDGWELKRMESLQLFEALSSTTIKILHLFLFMALSDWDKIPAFICTCNFDKKGKFKRQVREFSEGSS